MSRGAVTALNTCALDLSGHPALSMPCGTGADELPVGVQIIGPRFGEEAIYQLAFALEESLA
jgi:amidase